MTMRASQSPIRPAVVSMPNFGSALANQYYLPFTILPSASTVVASIGVWVAWPMYFPGMAITKVSCEVTVGGAGNGRIAIWSSDANGAPSALMSDSGNFSVAGTGIIETAITSLTLPDAVVWIGFNASVGATLRQGAVAVPLPLTSGADFQGVKRGVTRAVAFGAPPDPFGTIASVFGGPILAVRQ